jgi:signal transduction histidine kinase
MNSIVQDIRDFSMLLSKKFMVRIEQVNLSLLVGNCYRLFAKQFEMRNIEFEYCPDETTICIHTDGARLQQIIINLLSNAQKHTKNVPIRNNQGLYPALCGL